MHVLTKIFIVLVSLLAVLLVPLVVVYASNEDSYRAKYEAASSLAATANDNLQREQVAHADKVAELRLQIQELVASNESLFKEREAASGEIRRLQSDLKEAQSQQAGIRADLATIAQAVATGQDLVDTLLAEVKTMRTQALGAERRAVELEETLRDVYGQLEVAQAARKAMHEELQQLMEEHARSLESLATYVERYGRLDVELAAPTVPMVDLNATVVSVRRGSDRTLAEINAGSRDGVKEGWVMTIGRAGDFLGNLRIIAVDINHATGIVELEDPNGRGRVEAGDRVYARRGHS